MGMLACGAAGCGSSVGDICSRLDECNQLNQSVNDCTEIGEGNLDRLSSGQQADCESAITACLELQACSNFGPCARNLNCIGL